MPYFQAPLVSDPLTGGWRPDMPSVEWAATASAKNPPGTMITMASDADASAILAHNPATQQMPVGWTP